MLYCISKDEPSSHKPGQRWVVGNQNALSKQCTFECPNYEVIKIILDFVYIVDLTDNPNIHTIKTKYEG